MDNDIPDKPMFTNIDSDDEEDVEDKSIVLDDAKAKSAYGTKCTQIAPGGADKKFQFLGAFEKGFLILGE